MTERYGYAFSSLREAEFPLYRGGGNGEVPVLHVVAEDASLWHQMRLEHEHALKAELDPA